MKDVVLGALAAVVDAQPRSIALATGRRLGDVMRLLATQRRRLAYSNLEFALGSELGAAQRRAIVRRVFQHFGQAMVETLLLPRMVRAGLLRHVRHEGWEHLEQAVRGGRGAIVFTGHFGNWEVVALAQGVRGIPMDVVGRPLDDVRVAARLERTRGLTGNRFISKRHAARPMLRSLREGRTVGLVIDQNVGAGRGIFVDFFGHKAATTPALGVMALRAAVQVLPVFDYPEGDGHRIIYGPPLETRTTGDAEADILDITSRATRVIEDHVRRDPHLWMWMHNRWRSRPEPREAVPGLAGQRPAAGGAA